MYILVITIIGGLLFVGGLFAIQKVFDKKKTASVGKDVIVVEQRIAALDASIERGLAHLSEMSPLEGALKLESEIAELKNQLQEERQKLAKLDKQVEALQSSVEQEESQHNELKRGKDEAARLAEEIRTRQEELQSEYQRLESSLQQSLQQLDALSGEVGLSAEQQAALKNINSSLETSREQLNILTDVHAQARSRFLNLDSQYSELEKEFGKLVEKELSGEG